MADLFDNVDVASSTDGNGMARYTVTEFTRAVKNLIEAEYPSVAIEGEISNYKLHRPSGHRYFTLKDATSQLRCVMFRWQGEGLSFEPEEGMQVLALGNPTVYERGGQYQLTVFRLMPLGRGELLARLEELKKRLAEEGLFDRERPVPEYPATVGVITSPTGAAVRDIISVLSRRAPHVEIILRPALVQGVGAASDISRAITEMNEFTDADVLLVGRGGGSIEDLWCFNEEVTVRAIASSRIPVISAVGHETDFTLSDFAADLRAPTPSAAAELAVRDAAELKTLIDSHQATLGRRMIAVVDELARRVDAVRKGLGAERFLQVLNMRGQMVDEQVLRMKGAITDMLAQRERRYEGARGKLAALNPKSVLDRGYSIVFRESDGSVVTSAADVGEDDLIRIEPAQGIIRARVENPKNN